MPPDERDKSDRSILNRPYILVAVGFGLGYLARFVLGPPAAELEAVHRRFERPMPAAKPDVDMPLDRATDSESS